MNVAEEGITLLWKKGIHLATYIDNWLLAAHSSLRATHVPAIFNSGMDLLSRGNPSYRDQRLDPFTSRAILPTEISD